MAPIVLVVDDEAALPRLAEGVLRRAGYKVLAADSARMAIELCRRQGSVDVLIADANLQEMSGVELAGSLRKFSNPNLCLVVMSGWDYNSLLDKRLISI